MRISTMTRRAVLPLLALALAAANAVPLHARVPYDTYTQDQYGRALPTPPAYAPEAVIGGDIYIADEGGEAVHSPLKQPKGLFVDARDHIYVADTDNHRIVQFDENGGFLRAITLPESPFRQPQGVFVTDDAIYVADTGNERIVRLDRDGRLVREYRRPDSPYLTDSFTFSPTNVVVDDRGFLYVVVSGSYQGLLQLDPEGGFRGFFGTNTTEATWMDRLRRLLYTKEQLSRQVRLLPATIRNIEIDRNGYIYTVSGTAGEQIKKLNIRGDNLWAGKHFGVSPPDSATDVFEPVLSDIAVDRYGNVTVIDPSLNIVMQYDPDGELLFYWTGRVTPGMPQLGLNQSPVAVAANSRNELLILDDALNVIQRFKPTRFGEAVHAAHSLTQDGRYAESEAYWNEVLKLNARYAPGYKGLAYAAFYRGDYARAMELFRLAGDAEGYSDSFWQIRMAWFQRYFAWIANAAVVLFIAYMLATGLRKRFGWKRRPLRRPAHGRSDVLLGQLKHALTILRHPLDGFSDLRYANMGGYRSALMLLGLTVAVMLIRGYYTSFTFDPLPAAERHAGTETAIFLLIWLSWVVCHYLIGSIFRGEARFRDVFVGGAYSLVPIALLGLPLAVASHVLTLNEASIYYAFENAMMVWTGLLVFWKIQSLQNYSFGETIVTICLTAMAMLLMWVLIFIILGLSRDLLDFVHTIYLEVTM